MKFHKLFVASLAMLLAAPTCALAQSAVSNNTVVTNPLLWSDVPDPDIICVGDDYYMISTTAHLSPGAPIMHSKDLKHWNIISYVFDELHDSPANDLEGGNIYSRGQWAASLKYHDGLYYVFFGTGVSSYIYTAENPAGPWTMRVRFPVYYHDAGLLFDDDGKTYLIYGGTTAHVKEFNKDLTGFNPNGVDQDITTIGDGALLEGTHAYKVNGLYYLTQIWWPAGGERTEVCWRSKSITGPYERKVVFSDNMGYPGHGIAQGGFLQAHNGQWYAWLFQDHEAVGRIPYLLPCRWVDGWPMMGDENGKAPKTFTLEGIKEQGTTDIVSSDEFSGPKLNIDWQWNHNPNNTLWSLSQRPGYLRLTTGKVVSNLFEARNTLTQRTEGPRCSGIVKMDISHMKAGDHAGLSAFCSEPGTIEVVAGTSSKQLIMTDRSNTKASVRLNSDTVYLKMNCDFTSDNATFEYSTDGKNFTQLGPSFHMIFSMAHFTGNKFAIFNYATQAIGGYVDIDYFHYTKPNDDWEHASSTNPADMSSFIINAGGASLGGWEAWRAGGNGTDWQVQNASYTNGDVSINGFFERWVWTPGENQAGNDATLSDGYLRQTLKNIPNGVYTLEADVCSNQQHTPNKTDNEGTALYLATGENFADSVFTTVSTLNAKPEHKSVTIRVTDGTLRLGFATKNTESNWIAVDNFRLTLRGEDVNALQTDLSSAISQAETLIKKDINPKNKDDFQNAIDNAKAVSANSEATAEEVSNARVSLSKAYAAYRTVEEPNPSLPDTSSIKPGSDCTFIISDPHFKNGGKGWTNPQTIDQTNHDCEAFNKNFNTYISLEGMPNGKYTIRMQAFQRIGSNSNAYNDYKANGDKNVSAYLYANGNSIKIKNVMDEAADRSYTQDSIGLAPNGNIPADYTTPDGKYTPNSMQGGRYYFSNGKYWNEISTFVTDGKLTFGLRDDNHVNGGWVLFDNVQLVYDGSSYEALKSELDSRKATIDELSTQPMSSDSLNYLVDCYNKAAALTDGGQELVNALVTIDGAIKEAQHSISIYDKLAKAVEWSKTMTDSLKRTSMSPETVYQSIESNMKQGTYKDTEIDNAVADLKARLNTYLLSDVVKDNTLSASNPADISYVIQSNDFENNSAEGWSKTVQGGLNYGCQEFFNTNFDLSQVLYGMPAGNYRLVVQGFYRYGGIDNQIAADYNGTVRNYSYAYINDKQKSLENISTGKEDVTDFNGGSTAGLKIYDTSVTPPLYVADNMSTANGFFNNWPENYLTNVELNLSQPTDLTIGVRKDELVNNDWTILNYVKLYYWGDNATGINSVDNDEKQYRQEIYSVNGAKQKHLERGVNIVKKTFSKGNVKVEKVIK